MGEDKITVNLQPNISHKASIEGQKTSTYTWKCHFTLYLISLVFPVLRFPIILQNLVATAFASGW
jgi:hypothetical protein